MFISGLGNVRGVGPMTKIFIGSSLVRVRDLDDQSLSLLVPALFKGEATSAGVADNRRLRVRLKRLNPHLDTYNEKRDR